MPYKSPPHSAGEAKITYFMFDTTFQNDVITPIPLDVEPEAVVDLLHEHGTVIHCQPIVTGHEIRERDPETGWILYDVYETISLLPFKLWEREITFQLHFRDKQDGVTSFINAAGVKSEADYTVRVGKDPEQEGVGWVVHERIESTCNFLLKWIVQMNMLPVRKKLHEQIIETLRERKRKSSKGGEGEGELCS